VASTFTWNVLSGSWNVAADWSGASGTPGSADTAIYNNSGLTFDVFSGGASAALFSVNGDLALAGPGNFGTISGTATNGFAILPGQQVTAAAVQLSGILQIAGPGAALISGGTVALGIGGTIGVYNQATLDALSLSAGVAFVLDPNALAEIGGGDIGSAGTLAIDPSATASFEGQLNAPVLNDGTFVVATTLSVQGAIGGDGVIDLAPIGSSPTTFGQADFYDPIASTETVVFPGTTLQTVDLFDTGTNSQDFTLSGFVPGDTIGVGITAANEPFVTSAVYTPTAANIGTLAIASGATLLQTPTLLGNYADESFLILPSTPTLTGQVPITEDFYPEQSRIVVAPNALATPIAAPPGSASDAYSWIAAAGGAWATLTNWEDLTTDSAATAAPGAANTVTLATGTVAMPIINGNGNALSVTQSGSVALNGVFDFGTLAQTGVIDLLPGDSLTAGQMTNVGFHSTLVANDARIDITGDFTMGDTFVDPGALDAYDTAIITAANLTLDDGGIWVDPTSSFEVGTAGAPADGALTIDPGDSITVVELGGALNANLVNNGTVLIGRFDNGSELTVGGSVTGSGTFELAFDSQLRLLGSVGAGQTIDLAGGGDLINASTAIAGTVENFGESDTILVNNSLEGVSFAGNDGSGILTFSDDAGVPRQTLAIGGSLSGFTFVDIPYPIIPGGAAILLAEGAPQSGPPGTPPAGSGVGATFTWDGGGGAWSDAALWDGASIAPGTGDTAIIGNSQNAPFILTGAGNAGTVTAESPMALSGSFDFGSLQVGTYTDGSPNLALQIGAHSTLIATQVALENLPLDIQGTGASLSVPGTLAFTGDEFEFDVLDGGVAQIATLTDPGTIDFQQFISVDATSILEIGTLGGAAAGDMTIDSGSTVTIGPDAALNIEAPVVNNGVLIADTAPLSGIGLAQGLSGDGTLELGPGAAVIVNASIAAAQTIDFTGTGDLLALESSGAISSGGETTFAGSPTVEGFNSTDTITVQGQATAATYTPTGAGTGTLTLSDGGATVMTMTLLGDYTGDQFLSFAAPILTGGQPTSTLYLAEPVSCYGAGTRIATPTGDVSIEDLTAGDLVLTYFGGVAPIRWAGSRAVDCRAHPEPTEVWPVRVRANALGPGHPRRDLFLSPDHALFLRGVLIPVKLLVNGTSIAQVKTDLVRYFHLELPEHSVILAEGAPAESYLDTGDRANFDGGATIRLFPNFATRLAPDLAMVWEMRGAAPLVMTGELIELARADVAANARLHGEFPRLVPRTG
jgi:hypothetical protein